MSNDTQSIRRLRGRRRIDATVALAAVLPLIALGAAALARPHTSAPVPQSPTAAALDTTSLVCPQAARGDDTVMTSLGVAGRAAITGTGTGKATAATLAAGVPQTLRVGSGAQILTVSGRGAPTLAASRWSSNPLAATQCDPPVTGEWFTGLGAGPYHDSVIELTNPLSGEAVVDLDLIGATGPVVADRLHGVAVPAHGTVSFDLLHTIPRLDTLALHATVERGQAVIDVHDHGRVLNKAASISDWLSGQRSPSRTNLMLGLVPGGSAQRLIVANPGTTQLNATLKLVTTDSVFAPAGAPAISLPPQSVVTVRLDRLLKRPVAHGALGIELDSTGAVTAELRRTADSDLATVGSGSAVSGPVSVVVPLGQKRLVVAGARRAGDLQVHRFDEHGAPLRTQRLTLSPQQGGVLTLPKGAVLVSLTSDNTAYLASVVADTKHGAAVLPLRSTPDSVRVPAVRPALR